MVALRLNQKQAEKVSDLAKEVANRLLADNTDVDIWDLESLFNNKFGYYYAPAWMRGKSRSPPRREWIEMYGD